jgi:hypothetical protein
MNIRLFLTLLLGLLGTQVLPAQDNVIITEFLAENDRGLLDEDGEEQDWIEIYNAGTNAVNLDGWFLTDSSGNLTKWRFPATTLPANQYLVVFASDKNRRIAGQPLHTSFALGRGGEYLALVKPDGVTVAFSYAPLEQAPDISYGVAVQQTTVPLISGNAPLHFLVPTSDVLGSNWTAVAFNDSTWTAATGGIGYETESPASVILADSAAEFSGVQGENNWFHGFYNKSIDAGNVYQASNFVAFPSNGGAYGPENYFTGTAWDWYSGNPPWTEIGRTNGHPNGSNNGLEHWAIRRWVSEIAGTVRVDWSLAKAGSGGNGVTGRIYHNNTSRDSAVIAGSNTSGTNRAVSFAVQVGDTIDIALDSVGTDGQANDGSDGSYYSARISILPSYTNQFSTSIASQMVGVNPGAFIRIPFNVTNAAALEFLTLRMKYDDGFAAYLNGEHIVSRNAPLDLPWNATSTDSRNNVDALAFEDIDITPGLGLLRQGQNVLAIHALNLSATDSDFLCAAELRGATLSLDPNARRYFTVPTPGAPNGVGNTNLGPLAFNAEHTPNEPLDTQDVVVTVATRPTFRPISGVNLTYRVMFNTEVTVPMFDDGQHGDGPAGDGVYGASIPNAASRVGEMVRWFVRATDTANNVTRLPAYQIPTASPQYFGTVVHNAGLTNPLPVLHMFIPQATLDTAGNDSLGRYPASIYYLGEFYDNIGMNRHGQSSAGFPRRSYDLDFNPGNNFRYDPNQDRVDDINLLTTYPDKAKMRNMLSYGIYKDAGSPYHFVYPIRVQHNSVYFADYHLVENGDENYLKRLGLDSRGALYKMYNTFDSPALGVNANAEKKTRKQEGNEDLVALWNGVTAGTNYLWDNVDVPGTMNFLAARILTGDVDCCHKNYYFYRDSEGNGEWTGMPWDVDLSFGRNWNGTSQYWDDTMYPNNGLDIGGNNRLFGALLNNPVMRQIYLRRIRTLMDELLQPPGTPADQLKFEAQIQHWRNLIIPDAELEKTRWPTWGGTASTPAGSSIISTCCTQSVAHASDILRTNYLPARRVSMYNRSPGTIPAAQPSNAVVQIASVEYNPTNANQAQEYIQFRNPNAYAVDMSFWSVTGAIRYTFKGGVVIPANGTLYLSPNVVEFRNRTTGPRRGQGIYVQGNYDGQLSARGETLVLVDQRGRVVTSSAYIGNPSTPQQYLRITEIMYHPTSPAPGSPYDNEEFEYIELKNIGPTALNLTGVHFKEGVEFAFAAGGVTNLGAGQTMLLVKNLAAFTSRYGSGHNIGGVYTGTLDNGGETIRLDDAVNEKILEFRYENNWYPSTDGMGFSLVVVNENAPYYMWQFKESWRPSGIDGGSPGGSDTPLPTVATILVNEVFAHSDVPDVDYIELYNPNPTAVNIGGWFISDDFAFPKKYRINTGVTIPAGGYVVFDETQFNANTNLANSFSFSSTGDEAYVFSGDGTNLTGYFNGYEFGAAFTGDSFGRYYMSTGAVHLVTQAARTRGATNSLPKVGPVVISEIMYHPPDLAGGVDDDTMEFVELRNLTGAAIPLFEHNAGWRIRGGVDFDFPSGASIPANGYAIVVAFHPLDPACAGAFRSRYNLAAGVPLYGPYSGKLDNSSDRVELQRPDAPEGNDIPFVLLEEVEYGDLPPWAQLADGIGPSLQRLDVTKYGNDAVNWTAVVATPNGAYPGGTMPSITAQPQDETAVAGFEGEFTVQAAGSPPLAYQWFHGTEQIFGATGPTLRLTNLTSADEGEYSVIVYNGAGFILSSNATLTVLIPASITRQPGDIVMRGSNAPGIYGHTFSNATFTVAATSSTTITYQWRWNGNNIPGATSPTLVIQNVTLDNVGTYDCVLTDAVRPITTDSAELIVNVPVIITQSPQSTVALVGDTVSFRVNTTGSEPFSYRWRRNGVAVNPQPNSAIYTLVNLQTNQSGQYSVVVTNAGFFQPGALSAIAFLTVLADRDGDRAPDAWETANGFDPDNPNDGGADADNDTMLNKDEFFAGTDPNDPQSYLAVEFDPLDGNALQFMAISNRSYSVQFIDNLSTGTWSTLAHAVSRTTNRLEKVADPDGGAKRFYRLITPLQE